MLCYSGNPLDRASEWRTDPAWLLAQRRSPAVRLLPLWRLEPFVTGPEDGPFAAGFLGAGAWESLAAEGASCVFLGLDEGRPRFALDISAAPNPTEGPLAGLGRFRGMRAVALRLPDRDIAILGQAKALIDWHGRHGFCPRCGAATLFADGGYRRICPACEAEHFPRIDPVVIMLPTLGEQCLLGRGRHFPPKMFSALAGFIEPGETIEEAVARELKEEVALEIERVRYHASQPWPFASSLMIGCFAETQSLDFHIDAREIEAALWLTRAEVRALLVGEQVKDIVLPTRIAIAHYLIRAWAAL